MVYTSADEAQEYLSFSDHGCVREWVFYGEIPFHAYEGLWKSIKQNQHSTFLSVSYSSGWSLKRHMNKKDHQDTLRPKGEDC